MNYQQNDVIEILNEKIAKLLDEEDIIYNLKEEEKKKEEKKQDLKKIASYENQSISIGKEKIRIYRMMFAINSIYIYYMNDEEIEANREKIISMIYNLGKYYRVLQEYTPSEINNFSNEELKKTITSTIDFKEYIFNLNLPDSDIYNLIPLDPDKIYELETLLTKFNNSKNKYLIIPKIINCIGNFISYNKIEELSKVENLSDMLRTQELHQIALFIKGCAIGNANNYKKPKTRTKQSR